MELKQKDYNGNNGNNDSNNNGNNNGNNQGENPVVPDIGAAGSKKKNIGLIAVIITAIAVLVAVFFYYERFQTVAVVNGERITRAELTDTLILYAGRDVLDELIEKKLILQECRQQNITVSDEEIEAELDELKEWFGSEEEFTEAMSQHGYTMDRLIEDVRVDLMRRKLVEAEIDVTEEALQAFFEDNRFLFDEQEQVKARHILVENEDDMAVLISRLEDGEDFAELAGEFSLDTFTKDTGGELGYVQRGDVAWPELDAVLFSLDPGEVSEPVESYSGFHVVEVMEREDSMVADFEEVKDEVREFMLEEKVFERMHIVIEQLYENADVENILFKE